MSKNLLVFEVLFPKKPLQEDKKAKDGSLPKLPPGIGNQGLLFFRVVSPKNEDHRSIRRSISMILWVSRFSQPLPRVASWLPCPDGQHRIRLIPLPLAHLLGLPFFRKRKAEIPFQLFKNIDQEAGPHLQVPKSRAHGPARGLG